MNCKTAGKKVFNANKARLLRRVLLGVAALALITVCFFGASCKRKIDYFSYVSELRKDVFAGENERFSVVVWAGAREKPYAADGIKNQTGLSLTVKVIRKDDTGEAVSVVVKFDDKSYEAKTGFHPVKSALCAEIDVDKLPEKQLICEVSCGETSDVITLSSKKNENTISYGEALEKAALKASEFLKANTKNGRLSAEIAVKLLCENDRNYYYVSFLSVSGEKKAYLVDGEDGSILAERDFSEKR